MARDESDREDLLREATALRDRIELEVPFVEEAIVIGYRSNGAPSFFLGQNEVYQFNASGEFRRGYLGGKLLKAEGGNVVRLLRERTNEEVQLVREALSDVDQKVMLDQMQAQLIRTATCLEENDFKIIGSVSHEITDIILHSVNWIRSLDIAILVANTPGVNRSS